MFLAHSDPSRQDVICCPAGTSLELRSRDVPAPDNKSLECCYRNSLPTVINLLNIVCTHYNDVTWVSVHLKSPATCLLIQQPAHDINNYNNRSTQKKPVRQQNAWFDTKKPGSTQKCPVRHKNALPSMHQLTLPLLNIPPPFLWEISFPILFQYFVFKNP